MTVKANYDRAYVSQWFQQNGVGFAIEAISQNQAG